MIWIIPVASILILILEACLIAPDKIPFLRRKKKK